CTPGEEQILHNGACYTKLNENNPWDRGLEACRGLGGEMISVTSPEEVDFLKAWSGAPNEFRIGIVYDATTGLRNWTDGSSYSFEIFKEGLFHACQTSSGIIGSRLRNKTCYTLLDTLKTWVDGEAYCNILGGHLLSVTSQDELEFLGRSSTIDGWTEIGLINELWLGLRYNATSRLKYWTDGSPYTFDAYKDGLDACIPGKEQILHNGACYTKLVDNDSWDGACIPGEEQILHNGACYTKLIDNDSWDGAWSGAPYEFWIGIVYDATTGLRNWTDGSPYSFEIFKEGLFHGWIEVGLVNELWLGLRYNATSRLKYWTDGSPYTFDAYKDGLDACIPGEEQILHNGACYTKLNESNSWAGGVETCRSLGGEMISVTSPEEVDFLKAWSGAANEFWIGIVYDATTGLRNWTDGSPYSFEIFTEGLFHGWNEIRLINELWLGLRYNFTSRLKYWTDGSPYIFDAYKDGLDVPGTLPNANEVKKSAQDILFHCRTTLTETRSSGFKQQRMNMSILSGFKRVLSCKCRGPNKGTAHSRSRNTRDRSFPGYLWDSTDPPGPRTHHSAGFDKKDIVNGAVVTLGHAPWEMGAT
ncbi:unnamed protein product, partial [Cyprideis torosa]